MTIHVVVGPPCAGKSTFVEQNAPPGIPRFDFDRVAETVSAATSREQISADAREAVLAMRRGMNGWLLDPETVVDELWLINSRPSDNTIDKFSAAGAEFHLIDPGKAECVARAERDGRSDRTLQAIERWYEAPPELPKQKGGEDVKLKDLDVSVKAGDDGGEFTAYAAVFDNVDSHGDVIVKGAFADSLSEWSESGNIMPVLYGHDFGDPFSNIGAVTKAEEDERGLKITGRLDLDNAKAAQVHRLLKEKRLSQMSFAFDVLDAAPVEKSGESVFELRKLKLYEVSVVPIGANQETEILAVKAAEAAEKTAPNGDLAEAIGRLVDALKGFSAAPFDTEPGTTTDHGGREKDTEPNTSGAARAALAKLSLLEKETL